MWRFTRHMREKSAKCALVPLAAVLVALSGCGGGGSTTTAAKNQPKETTQKLPKLPPGWKPHRDKKIGYAIGVPTGWQVGASRRSALLRSPDHLVAVTLTADRDPRAFAVPLERFASQALGALPGFKVPLYPSKPRPFKGTPLKGVQTTATGAQAGGLKEQATLVVLRRDHLVNYTAAVVGNAQQPGTQLDRAVALRMIQTLRDQPVKNGGA